MGGNGENVTKVVTGWYYQKVPLNMIFIKLYSVYNDNVLRSSLNCPRNFKVCPNVFFMRLVTNFVVHFKNSLCKI